MRRKIGKVTPRSIPVAVLDVETTGFGHADRVVEISIATLDPDTLEVVEEYDTLVNPLRDIPGPVSRVHGLTASDLEAAPTFAEIAPAVAKRINGSVLVAHNASFDTRMLDNEFKRAKMPFDGGIPFCTCSSMGRMSLKDACASYDITIQRHHRALSDVRATAALYKEIAKRKGAKVLRDSTVAQCSADGQDVVIRTLRREALGAPPIERVARSPWKEPRLHYRYAVNAALDDNQISSEEWNALNDLANTLGLTSAERVAQHLTIYQRALNASGRDGHISRQESLYLCTLAQTLALTNVIAPEESSPNNSITWARETRVCFTGSGGEMLPRDEMQMIAERIGHIPVPRVTKRLNLLVAANISSHSTKVVKARSYGIHVADAGSYLTHAYKTLDQ
ncbi:MAG: exonuclease domain-containing protein [Gammaproteobacteria bacterium]|nr:exonuclease domain-containing protein [Gammaproteobacteria bacterium]